MPTELTGKVAVVTGGSRGIGFSIAQALLAEGAKVFICGRDPKALQAALEKLRSAAMRRPVDGLNETDAKHFSRVAARVA